MANLYYRETPAGTAELEPSAIEPGALVEVAGEEARHAVRVSRLRQGERILVGDGRGTVGSGTVEATARERFAVRIEKVRREPAPEPRLVLVQALAKGDRDERAVEQATEFGVDAIVPWRAARSVSRWDDAEKAEKGRAKWARIAREASKQSLRPWVPEVREPIDTEALCLLAAREEIAVLLLDPRGARTLSSWAADRAPQPHLPGAVAEYCVVVGPEGGFAEEELSRLTEAGATPLVLGATVLRTSSAGPAALAVLNVALGRW
ncbi:16S rRNA (uracil(1498)-N(3))-methyltransferase [Leucobacter massiliensis]|uniref:Ribosomal RNA small subunit methyltransferase E n=1 Tax=Leucobacter massiliensis TaxID=1686285 RepID=A0A2S9QRM6_9MICO|nr:16S rRNA (uracil(1498)-N(3))-methyltransferase [Leucobacter massiliensis]PRI12240.1 16S rRNA (uracil(1498)-N(3))-methyltransferase [Leucobacter massiliensis]